jgi:hypothetical protein
VQEEEARAGDGSVRAVAIYSRNGFGRGTAADGGRGTDVAEGSAREFEGVVAEALIGGWAWRYAFAAACWPIARY